MDAIRTYFAKDSDEIILDAITTVIVGGAIVCLAGLVIAPAFFIPVGIAIFCITAAIAIFG